VNAVNGGDTVFLGLCVCLCARSEPVNQTVGALNANSSKTDKPTDFKFDDHVSTDIPDQSINQSIKRFVGGLSSVTTARSSVDGQCMVKKRFPEHVCLAEGTKCGQWEVIQSLRAGDRKSSATNSRQSADIGHYQAIGADGTQQSPTR